MAEPIDLNGMTSPPGDGVHTSPPTSRRVSPVAEAPACAEECRRVLLDIMAAQGADVHATWAPPLFPTGYEPLNMDCPHGVLWFMEPTAEQRLKWAAGESRG